MHANSPHKRKQAHQAPFSERSRKNWERKRAPAPYARIVGRPCEQASKQAGKQASRQARRQEIVFRVRRGEK